jgi:hypothetical protein
MPEPISSAIPHHASTFGVSPQAHSARSKWDQIAHGDQHGREKAYERVDIESFRLRLNVQEDPQEAGADCQPAQIHRLPAFAATA